MSQNHPNRFLVNVFEHSLRRHATLTRGEMRRACAFNADIEALTTATGTRPDETAIAAKLGVSIEKLRTDYNSAEPIRFEPVDDIYSDDKPWFASDDLDAFEQLADAELCGVLVEAISALPVRKAQVVPLYYVEELNLEEIELVLGVGAARVCQIKKSAHDRPKRPLLRRS